MDNNIISRILSPAGYVYDFFTKRRIIKNIPQKCSVPVICVGNIYMGGSGKTPVCVEIADFLARNKKNVFFLSRGYKSKKKYIKISQDDTAVNVGDEPLLLSQTAPVIIAPDRVIGADIAVKNGADVIIMDDGFQNPFLYKDFSIITIDGGTGLGNEKIFPAGPLRESINNAIKRANAIIIIGKDVFNLSGLIKKISQIPVYNASIIPNPSKTDELFEKKVIAFAGIGRPEKFYNTLTDIGANIIKTFDFPDHHNFSYKEISNIIKEGEKNNATVITTEKDYMRIDKKQKNLIKFLDIRLEINKVELLEKQISDKMNEKNNP